jgi:hypothetical protein
MQMATLSADLMRLAALLIAMTFILNFDAGFIASRATARTGCLVLALLAAPAWSQDPPASSTGATTFSSEIDEICPEAVREAAELRSRTKTPAVHAPPTRPALRENLLLMAKQDQEARASIHFSEPKSPEVVHVLQVDASNLKRLKHIVAQDGFPTAEMVGLDGVAAAWLLTVHAEGDPDFQEKVLKLTKEHVRRGEVRSADVALLTDDILSARDKPQRYGTNFVLRDGELKPAPMEDEAHIDERRRAAGLGTLANYACIMRAMYGSPKSQKPGSSNAPE